MADPSLFDLGRYDSEDRARGPRSALRAPREQSTRSAAGKGRTRTHRHTGRARHVPTRRADDGAHAARVPEGTPARPATLGAAHSGASLQDAVALLDKDVQTPRCHAGLSVKRMTAPEG